MQYCNTGCCTQRRATLRLLLSRGQDLLTLEVNATSVTWERGTLDGSKVLESLAAGKTSIAIRVLPAYDSDLRTQPGAMCAVRISRLSSRMPSHPRILFAGGLGLSIMGSPCWADVHARQPSVLFERQGAH